MLSGPAETQETAVKRRSRPRRPRGKRRNTIAGTDQKEIRQAIGGLVSVLDPATVNRRTSKSPIGFFQLRRRFFSARNFLPNLTVNSELRLKSLVPGDDGLEIVSRS